MHWDKVGKRKYLEPKLVEQATNAIKKIQERMKTSQICQKSYTDQRHRRLKFEVGKKMFLKIYPM